MRGDEIKMSGDVLAQAAVSEGFKPLKKRLTDPVPTTTPLPRGREKPRSFSESYVAPKTYRLGSLAELKIEELSHAVNFNASFTVVAAPQKGSWKHSRKHVALILQNQRSRATLSMDRGLFIIFGFIMFSILVGRTAAYTVAVPHGVSSRSSGGPLHFAPLHTTTATSPKKTTTDSVSAATTKLRRLTRYLTNGLGASSQAVEEALTFAEYAHEGQFRKSGEEYVVHPIETACILAEMRADVDTVVAGLLHDVVEDTDWSTEELRAKFGESVSNIVAGVTDVEAVIPADEDHVQELSKDAKDAYNKKRLLLAMGADLNVVLVKLADRVHNMRTLGAMPPEKRAKKARETLDFFVPVAHAVGVAPLEMELRYLVSLHLPGDEQGQGNAAAPDPSDTMNPHTRPSWGLFGQKPKNLFAEKPCPALLHQFLDTDEELRLADVEHKLARHRETWAAHAAATAPHLSSAIERIASMDSHPHQQAQQEDSDEWLRGILGTGIEEEGRHRAHYATGLAARAMRFMDATPSAFGLDARPVIN